MLTKKYLKNKNVLEAVHDRMDYLFDNYDNIIVSVSGGKDSSVLLHLLKEEAKKRNRTIFTFFISEEHQYNATYKMIRYQLESDYEHIIPIMYQVPYYITNIGSYDSANLAYDPDVDPSLYVLPLVPYSIKHMLVDLKRTNYNKGEFHKTLATINKYMPLSIAEAIKNWKAFTGIPTVGDDINPNGRSVLLQGVRSSESLNRQRMVLRMALSAVKNGRDMKCWIKPQEGNPLLDVAYPIYDWNVSDIYKYMNIQGARVMEDSDFNEDCSPKVHDGTGDFIYHRYYNFALKNGTSPLKSRVSSLLHENAYKSIHELQKFEPETYEKLLRRFPGISFLQETGKSAKVFGVKELPHQFKTWVEYMNFLLDTLPEENDQQKDTKKYFIDKVKKYNVNEYIARQMCVKIIRSDRENNFVIKGGTDAIDKHQYWLDFWKERLL